LNKHTPDNYAQYISDALDYLHVNLPRALVNLVLVLDVRNVQKLNSGGNVCKKLHSRTCPCAAFPTGNDSSTLDEWIPQYHQKLLDLVNTGKYDQDDFTVVIQPFMAHTQLPKTTAGDIDFSYFAPDCFHFSGKRTVQSHSRMNTKPGSCLGKGHSRAALSLWNNMLEPVGSKQWQWHQEDELQCPTNERPYFFTRRNSPQSMEKMPHKTLEESTSK
jgi:phospholipase B1, membrane-associated